MTAPSPIIGIDLGTTFSVVAFLNDKGIPEIIPNREGERVTPSVVLFDGDDPIVGTIAKDSAVSSPLNVVQYFKRQMGNKDWKFITQHGSVYKPEEISALVLKRLKEDAESFLGTEVSGVVITVPAYFNDAQRQATKDAGRIAGLNVLRIINEPTAAALAYGLKPNDKRQRILVYDLGGGTFDVTILRIVEGNIMVEATGGDKNLGGFDWDNCLMAHLDNQFKSAGGEGILDDPEAEAELRSKCELAKRTLSSRDRATILLNYQGQVVTTHITLRDFEELTKPLLNRTLTIMRHVLEDAGLNWEDIDKILLVGGSTRMQAVSRCIRETTGIPPSTELHPDEIVAMGAAVQGALISRESGDVTLARNALLPIVRAIDVSSHSLGVIAVDEVEQDVNSIILHKNSEIPCTASETYSTVSYHQRQIRIRVTQGEDVDVNYVDIIGEATISIPPYPKGSPIEVIFEYDLNGQILVSVKDLTANRMLDGNFTVFVRRANMLPEVVEQRRLAFKTINVN